MTKHISQKLEVIGTERQFLEFWESVKSDFSVFDFGKIVPMPGRLMINNGDGVELLKQLGNVTDVIKEISRINKPWLLNYRQVRNVIRASKNYAEYGYYTWHDYRLDKWGCVFKALNIRVRYMSSGAENAFIILFDTIDSVPEGILRTLKDKFPGVGFYHSVIDEYII